jgi:hypothetical protein
MFQPRPSRTASDPEDMFAGNAFLPPIPKQFRVTIDEEHLVWRFEIIDPPVPTNRQARLDYCIYFCPMSLANSAAVSNRTRAVAAFQQSTLIVTVGASNQGGAVITSSSRFFLEDGFFFCTARNLSLYETGFNGPVRSPVGTVVNGLFVPPEVSDPQVVNTHVDIFGQDVVQLDFSAITPSDGQGVTGVAMTDVGSGYSAPPTVSFTSNDGGSGAEAVAELVLDKVARVIVTDPGSGYVIPPTVVFTGANTTPATADASVGAATLFAGYQLYIEGYGSPGAPVRESAHADKDFSQLPGSRIGGTMYLLPDDHNTTFYFVSVSPNGARRDDPTAAPSVNFPGGIT